MYVMTMNETAGQISPKSPDFLVLVALSCVSAVIAVIGNTVVLTAVYRMKTLHTISNFFIASLAAADLVVGIFLNPLLAYKAIFFSYLYPERLLEGSAFDMVEDFAWIQAIVATTFGLTAISIDRYVAVNFGLRYRELASRKQCIIAIMSVWISSVVFASVRLFTTKPQHLSVLWLVMGIVTCIVPLIIITFCYLSIFIAARNQARKIRENTLRRTGEEAWNDSNTQVSHRKSAITVAIVILLFIVLWVPSLVTAAIQLGSDKAKDQKTLYIFERRVWLWVSLLAYFSSAINPWIYSIRSTQFRIACKNFFKCPNVPHFRRVQAAVHVPTTVIAEEIINLEQIRSFDARNNHELH